MKELIRDKIHSYIIASNPNSQIYPSTAFASMTGLDSLKIMDMIMDLEDSFDITLPMNLIGDIKTVGQLTDLVYNRIQDTDNIMAD